MEKVRADILKLDLPRTTAARIVIAAPAQEIFNRIADPRSHQLFDGSGTIQNSVSGPVRLSLGAKFGMLFRSNCSCVYSPLVSMIRAFLPLTLVFILSLT